MSSPHMYEDRLFTPDQVTVERNRRGIYLKRHVKMPTRWDFLMYFWHRLGGGM